MLDSQTSLLQVHVYTKRDWKILVAKKIKAKYLGLKSHYAKHNFSQN